MYNLHFATPTVFKKPLTRPPRMFAGAEEFMRGAGLPFKKGYLWSGHM